MSDKPRLRDQLAIEERLLIVGERYNVSLTGKRWPRAEQYVRDDPRRWCEISLRLGAFGTGLSARTELNSAGRRKLQSLGLSVDHAMNLLPPGEPGEWNHAGAWQTVQQLLDLMTIACYSAEVYKCTNGALSRWAFTRVVLLGRKVAAVFGFERVPFFEPVAYEHIIVIPHPSGLNRFWNSPAQVERGRVLVKEWLS